MPSSTGHPVSVLAANAQIKDREEGGRHLKLDLLPVPRAAVLCPVRFHLTRTLGVRLAQGERIVEVLKQNRSAPVPVEKQVAILYATIHDLLVKVKVADVAEYEKGLYEYLENDAAGAAVMETIRTTGNLDKDN